MGDHPVMTKRQYIPIDLEEVRQRVADGASSREIAAEVGTTHASVYRLCDKAGISIRGRGIPKRPHENIDTVIADMRPAEALEYVLEAFKQQTGQDDETLAYAASLGLTPSEAMVFGMLYRNLGHMVPLARLIAFMDASQQGKKDRDTLILLRVYISRMRVKLASKYSLRKLHGHGYVMVPA